MTLVDEICVFRHNCTERSLPIKDAQGIQTTKCIFFAAVVLFIANSVVQKVTKRRSWREPSGEQEKTMVAGALPFLGHALSMMRKNPIDWLHELRQKYGPVFCYREGTRKVLAIADADLCHNILNTKLDHWVNRRPLPFLPKEKFKQNIIIARGERWKQLRKVIVPMFSPTTNKEQLFPFLKDAVPYVLGNIERDARAGDSVCEIYRHLQWYSMAMVEYRIFGFDTERVLQEDKEVLHTAKKIINTMPNDLILGLTVIFPQIEFLTKKIRDLKVWRKWECSFTYNHKLRDILRNLLDEQAAQPQREDGRESILQSLLKSGLTREETIEQGVILLVVAFETASSSLAFLLHLLARHQDVQRRLREELRASCHINDPCSEVDHDTLMGLPYLNAVIKESLRLYPVGAMFVNRCPMTDTTVDTPRGPVQLTTNDFIQINVKSLHTDPDHWKDPNTFWPDRFLPENLNSVNTKAYLPFGKGQRACLGKNLTILEMKMILCHMLQRNHLFLNERTPDPDMFWYATLHPKDNVYIGLHPLSECTCDV